MDKKEVLRRIYRGDVASDRRRLFFPRSEDLSAAVQAKLQTLILEDAAQSVSAFDSDERLYRLEKL